MKDKNIINLEIIVIMQGYIDVQHIAYLSEWLELNINYDLTKKDETCGIRY